MNRHLLFGHVQVEIILLGQQMRLVKRKSADDISLVWLFGVWVCILLMSPAALTSPDIAFRAFGWTNVVFFTGVVFATVKYHHKFKK